jgi:uncharacterized membrane protein
LPVFEQITGHACLALLSPVHLSQIHLQTLNMAETNPNTRLEAFCDAVFAIALTLLIIDIKIPSTVTINNTAEFWLALKHVTPSIIAFITSFIIIFITWVNHHNGAKLVNKSTPSFIYATGFLLLTVVFIPFPTSLIGENILTDHAAPSIMLYNALTAVQGIAWLIISEVVLKNHLYKNEKSAIQIRINRRNGYFAITVYTILAILAFWFPIVIAIITALLWIFWLIAGINIKEEEVN